MTRNLKIIILLTCLVILIPIFNGCNQEGREVAFSGYSPESKEINKNITFASVSFDYMIYDDVDSTYYYLVYLSGLEGDYDDNSNRKCKSVSEFQNVGNKRHEHFMIPQETLEKSESFKPAIAIYKDKNCNQLVTTYFGSKFKIVEENSTTRVIDDVIDKIGGSEHYCKVDINGNYDSVGVSNNSLFDEIAYSQIGYLYKSTNSHLNSCVYSTSGSGVYSKYGGQASTPSQASIHFVKWVAKKAGILDKFPDFSTVDDLIEWATENNRISVVNGFEPTSSHSGDLFITLIDDVVGIRVSGSVVQYKYEENKPGSIAATWLLQKDVLIDMEGITY